MTAQITRTRTLLAALALMLACGGSDAALPPGPASIAGRVTSVSRAGERIGAIRVELKPGDRAGSPKANVRVTQGTDILTPTPTPARATFDDLRVGQWVRVWFTGPVRESYPVQADAGTIVIDSIGSARPPLPPAAPAPFAGWPADQSTSQLGNLDSLRLVVPACRETVPVFGADSAGPLRPGQSRSELLARCPNVLALWDFGDEGLPAPVLLVRLGPVRVVVALDDTLASSRVISLWTTDTVARTAAGVGPGSTLAALVRAAGRPTLVEGECRIGAVYPEIPGISFLLDMQRRLPCEDFAGIVNTNAVERLPRETTVGRLIIFRRE